MRKPTNMWAFFWLRHAHLVPLRRARRAHYGAEGSTLDAQAALPLYARYTCAVAQVQLRRGNLLTPFNQALGYGQVLAACNAFKRFSKRAS